MPGNEPHRIDDDADSLVVGALFSSTGTLAATEQSIMQGAVLAAEEINAAGGVLGRPVRLVISDYGSDPVMAGRCARAFVQEEGIHVLLGGYTSASRLTISPTVDPVQGLYLYPTYYEGLEFEAGTVYLGAVPNQYLEVYVEWIFATLGSRVYIVGSDYVYPRTIGAMIHGLARKEQAEIVGDRYLPIGATDMSRVMRDLHELAPDVVICNLVGVDSVGAFYSEFAAAGFTPQTMPIAATVTSEFEISKVGADYVDGHYMASTYFSSLTNAENSRYVQALRQRFGADAVAHVTQVGAYNGMWILADVLRRAQGVSIDRIREHLVGARFAGNPGGFPIEIQPNHHSSHPAYIGRATAAGEYEVIASFTPVDPDPYPPSLVRLAKRPRE